ncbi:hypothetical protein ACN38_g11056 [Penicillium nordicum]|uniref:Uncharacterized protein n=1 Tax=Penicillium nordicum TaxID=229535 RepID=A0A0M8NZD9_9EURO|nr:hypothetical protein ACN38_g11056 [Penicillium nordicum]
MVQTHTKPMVGSRTMTKHAVVRLYLVTYLDINLSSPLKSPLHARKGIEVFVQRFYSVIAVLPAFVDDILAEQVICRWEMLWLRPAIVFKIVIVEDPPCCDRINDTAEAEYINS